jgi:hypothetical protein
MRTKLPPDWTGPEQPGFGPRGQHDRPVGLASPVWRQESAPNGNHGRRRRVAKRSPTTSADSGSKTPAPAAPHPLGAAGAPASDATHAPPEHAPPGHGVPSDSAARDPQTGTPLEHSTVPSWHLSAELQEAPAAQALHTPE